MPWRTETLALQPRKSPTHLSNSSPQRFFLVSSLKASRTFFVFQPNARKGDLYCWTVLSSRHGQFGFRRGLRDLQVMRNLIFAALCLATASAALGQNVRPASAETSGPRPIARKEGRKILATIPTVDTESESETDCSHLVHQVYARAGFPYDYVSSRELYFGSTNFMRVHAPQAGDLVVWRGHVGIVIDPKEHSFFSSLRSGPDTQFYDSPYWRSRGSARFFRYTTGKPLPSGRALEATRHADQQPVQTASPGSRMAKPATTFEANSTATGETCSATIVETPQEIVLQVARKNPSPDELLAAFVEMNRDSGESLCTPGLSSLGKPIVVYREVRVSAIQVKGKRGTALVRIESLGAPPNMQTDSQHRWKEQSLEFEKTKRGWVMSPIQEAAYVKREVALQVLSARLAELAQNTDTTPEQEREQKQIIRFLNLLVADDSSAASAQSN